MALSLRTFLALESTLASASSKMLGRDELVLHRVGLALGRFEHAGSSPRLGCGGDPPLTLGKRLQFGCDDAVELRAVDADLVEQRAR